MKYLIFSMLLVSCGKSAIDSTTSASALAKSDLGSLTCSQVSECLKDCGNVKYSGCTVSNSRYTCPFDADEKFNQCLSQNVQLVDGSYVILEK